KQVVKQDRDFSVQEAAVKALRNMRIRASVHFPPEHENREEQEAPPDPQKKRWDMRSLADLIQALQKGGEYDIRYSAADGLAKLGDRRAVPALIQSLESDENINVRLAAAIGLGKLGDPRAVPALIQALKQGDKDKLFR